MKILIDTIVDDEKVRNIYIESDDLQFSVRVYSDKLDAKGKPHQISTNYFSTLQGACKYVLSNMIVKKTTASDLKELVDCMDNIENRMIVMVCNLANNNQPG